MNYDLEERTVLFSECLLKTCKKVSLSILNKNIVEQLLRCGTSVGANYCEANGASSRKDFRSKILICKREAKETLYWIRLLSKVVDEGVINELKILWKEGKEIMLIFSKIGSSTKIIKN